MTILNKQKQKAAPLSMIVVPQMSLQTQKALLLKTQIQNDYGHWTLLGFIAKTMVQI